MCLMCLMILMFCFMNDLCACHFVAFHVVSVTLFINDFTYSIFSATSANFPQDWVLECERRSVALFVSACAMYVCTHHTHTHTHTHTRTRTHTIIMAIRWSIPHKPTLLVPFLVQVHTEVYTQVHTHTQ